MFGVFLGMLAGVLLGLPLAFCSVRTSYTRQQGVQHMSEQILEPEGIQVCVCVRVSVFVKCAITNSHLCIGRVQNM